MWSLTILLSEATLDLQVSATPFAAVLSLFDCGNSKGLLFQIAALVPLVYMSVCVYSSLFKLSAFSPFCLRGNRQSGGGGAGVQRAAAGQAAVSAGV